MTHPTANRIASNNSVNYSATHKHAATNLSNGNSYTYDANGNMITRNANGQSFEFDYDAENRLVTVTGVNGTILSASFEYDADGKRIKSTMDGETTLFVGGHYEKTGTSVTKYYTAGASRVAMRKDGTLTYLLADHLGSTSLSTDANGNRTSELRYKPWGETRFSFGTMPTKYQFTGQYGYTDDPSTPQAEGFGLVYFNARWMDPQLGRFVQADTVIPSGTQGYDRYAYTYNNPLRYNDPTGHWGINFSSDNWIPYLSLGADPSFTAGFFDAAAFICDAGAWSIDLTSAAVSLGIATAGTAVAGPFGTVTGFAAGEAVAAPGVFVGNLCASAASGFSIASDILTGDTSIDGSLEITEHSFDFEYNATYGADTQVAGNGLALGWTVPTSYASLVMQSAVFAYDIDSALSVIGLPNLGISEMIPPIERDIDVEFIY